MPVPYANKLLGGSMLAWIKTHRFILIPAGVLVFFVLLFAILKGPNLPVALSHQIQVAGAAGVATATLAADPTVSAVSVDPTQNFLFVLFQSLGGFTGVAAMALAGLAVQLILKLLSTNLLSKWFPQLLGRWKMTVVMGLSLVSGILALMVPPTSLSLVAALLNSTTLTAFTIFAHQLYHQFTEVVPADPKIVIPVPVQAAAPTSAPAPKT